MIPARSARISPRKRNLLVRAFALDMTATQASKFAKVNRNTANLWFQSFRAQILEQQRKAPRLFGEVEIDTAFFGKTGKKKAAALKKRGLPLPSRKPIGVFGLLQRGGKVYVHMVPDSSARTLMPIIRLVVEPDSTIYSDEWRSFSQLKVDGYTHLSVNHSREFVGRDGAHTGSIDSFWSFAKRRLAKFNGMYRQTANLHLKECEFRYNSDDIEKDLKTLLFPTAKEKRKTQPFLRQRKRKTPIPSPRKKVQRRSSQAPTPSA